MGNEKSTANNKSDAEKQISTQSKSILSRRQRINIQTVQNVHLIWLDSNINDNSADCRNTISQLRRTVNEINTFTDGEECIQFIDDINDNKVCIIVSGSLGQNIVPQVHNMSQVDSIFIFCGNKTYHEQWAKEWPKIKDVFTEIAPICEALKQAAQQCEQSAISISFVATDDASKKNLDQLDPIFMYTQILKEILLTIKFNNGHIKEFIDYCQEAFVDNDKELENINELKTKYHMKTPIWWYTCEMFLYPMLNRCLRSMNMDIIIKMGFFITDLHRQIEKLHSKQFRHNKSKELFVVYRGQGGLMSFNNFLSTSKKHEVSLRFAHRALPNMDMVGILFIMTIDPRKSTAPFASIIEVGYFGNQEDEILFSMHSIFRIGEMKRMGENQRLFEVNLTLTDDNDKDLHLLTDHIRKETFPQDKGWHRMGLLLLKAGESAKALQVYETLLAQTSGMSERAEIYNQLGWTKADRGEYEEAIIFYTKALEIYKKTLPSTHLNLASYYNNIGNVYSNMGDYPKALSSHEKALEIWKQSLPSNHSDLASSYNNIGSVYSNMGDYTNALSFHEKALEIRKQSLPSNHPNLATSYNNIGSVYSDMGDYPKALSSHEKAFEIRKQSLPSNHPDLASSYNNIGSVYSDMADYPKALLYHEKAFEIRRQSVSLNHPGFASSYNNIGEIYLKMQDYSKSLSFHERALELHIQSLPSNHPYAATSYNNIGSVHYSMGDYPKALSSHEKALEIQIQSVPSNHPDLATSYNNIGTVYYSMGDYRKALSYYEKALEIRRQSLPLSHPDFASSYNSIGEIYLKIQDYSKALSFHEKALEIRRQSLPSNHPDLAASYNNIGAVNSAMDDYSKALSFHTKALEIQKQSLPSNHLDFAMSYNNIGEVHLKMQEYPKAISFFETTLTILQKTLPSKHPSYTYLYKNIGDVYNGIEEYSKAGSFYQRAIEIGEFSLLTKHPELQKLKINLENVQKKL